MGSESRAMGRGEAGGVCRAHGGAAKFAKPGLDNPFLKLTEVGTPGLWRPRTAPADVRSSSLCVARRTPNGLCSGGHHPVPFRRFS